MDPNQSDRDDESSLRYAGWRAVLACFLMAMFMFGFGFYGNGLYLAELQRLRSWPAALISGAISLGMLISNLLAIFTSELIAWLGIRRLLLFGLAGLAASTMLLAVVREPWQLYVAFILMSFGWTGMGTVVLATVVSTWFVRRRGLALSLAFNGASCGGVVVVPLLVVCTQAIGFSAAMLAATATMIIVVVAVVTMWVGPDAAPRERSASNSQQPAAAKPMSRTIVLRRRAFWSITIPFALALLAQVGFIVHQIAVLEPKIGRSSAGVAVAVTSSMALIGRICLGMAADRFDPRLLTALSFVSQAAALVIIAQTDSAAVLFAGCAMLGFSVGNLITLPPLIIHREFEAPAFTVVLALSTAVSGMICSFGPGAVGLVRSVSGGYGGAIALCVSLEVVAAVMVLWGGRRELVAAV